ncbi:hypothetical protein TruAng_007989 [Truncatella angustata]|nr:hypothetical protein TruAng_007989 [Truncatella angustata]
MRSIYIAILLAWLSKFAGAWPPGSLVESDYNGWNKINRFFVLYATSIGLLHGVQPSDSNPFGNTGTTSANGRNWVEYLTDTYNKNNTWTYDFAQSGATIDVDVQASAQLVDVDGQIADQFLPIYASQSGFYTGPSSLFGIWIGINDIYNSFLLQDSTKNAALIARLRELVVELYDAGARNFIFLNMPPLERAPKVTGSSAAATRIPIMKTTVGDYNARLWKLARSVNHDLGYTTVFYYDVNTLFNSIIDDPSQFVETSIYKDTTSFCSAYKNGTPGWNTKYDECEYAANEYLWTNNFHPSQPAHQLLAKEIGDMLTRGASV